MDELWAKIAAVNLIPVRQKFAFKKGWWWRLCQDALVIERQYRQFVYLIASNPGKTVVPWSRDLDDFWHEHILDTARYAQDCEAIMGSFIHHNPNLPEGSRPYREAFAATRQMYKSAFGETVRKRRKRLVGDAGCGAVMPVVFCDGGASVSHHGDGHHGDSGGHHGDAGGHHGGGDAGGGHGGGHGCGGHGCGGHGCGGHGCGGH